ncbi:MAG: SWIM zinc finger family protein [Jatrophihabitantaceae bacterium]
MNRNNRWQQYPASRPRAVEGGLKARTARGAIGSSWWSRRFLDVLESFAMGSRLTRGRNYARKGQVISLDVSPGEVRAAVQGSRARPYNVRIGLAPFGELVWAKAEIALSEQALPSAKLLAGEVPPELEQIFADAGAPLFPRVVNELDQRCSCPDWEVPCKHLAATFYLLAEAFDADPFLLLRWRGRDREQLLNRLRELRSEPDGTNGPSSQRGTGHISPPPAAGATLALAGLSETATEVDRFWLPPPPLPRRPAVLAVDPALLLRQLPPPGPALGGEALAQRLRSAYEQFAKTAE